VSDARLRRRAWRTWYRAKWLLWQRRVVRRDHVTHIAGMDLVVPPGVLDPKIFLSGDVLADAMVALARPGMSVLDLGTGCGIGALVAARAGCGRVIATDIDPVAANSARANAVLRGFGDVIDVRVGDLFEPVADERFDLVAFNPPYLTPGRPGSYRVAMQGTPALAKRFAMELGERLTPTGRAVLILSTSGPADAWLAPLRASGYEVETVLERDVGSETITAFGLATGGRTRCPRDR
jgi:release factor glutamine methyltransferase